MNNKGASAQSGQCSCYLQRLVRVCAVRLRPYCMNIVHVYCKVMERLTLQRVYRIDRSIKWLPRSVVFYTMYTPVLKKTVVLWHGAVRQSVNNLKDRCMVYIRSRQSHTKMCSPFLSYAHLNIVKKMYAPQLSNCCIRVKNNNASLKLRKT